MLDFAGKVAVITGAASGIGRGLAGCFARERMRLVLADVEELPLAEVQRELEKEGTEVLAVRTDVADAAAVRVLAASARERFGRVHVLCNNAGVAGGGSGALWEASERDWAWVLGVNLMGVVHGIQAFLPGMLEHGEAGHVINTSSVLGLQTGGGSIYGVSKHAVTRLTEGLYYDLRARGSRIGASVLCPGLVATRIVSADRNRPESLRNPVPAAVAEQARARRDTAQQRFLDQGMSPEQVGMIVLDAIREDRFYILTHPGVKRQVERRMKDILEDRSPSPIDPRGAA
jgi:NAD(P)-dependent dehydrogenase (short-subunit alcohol dehydrogenase family)